MSEVFNRRKIDLMLEMCERENLSHINESYDEDEEYDEDDCDCNCDGEYAYDEDEEDELEDILDDLDEVPDDIVYTPEMVVVVGVGSGINEHYVVEYDMLAKLMESKNIDEKAAMVQVCEANDLSLENTYLLIESDKEFKEEIAEARCKGGSKAVKEKAGKFNKKIKDLKKKGVKMMKKKK